ncbi:MAG: DNA-processing protein DprA [Saprospiraceae bacterium]
MTDRQLYQIALTLLPQVGAITAKTLVSYCGSAEAVFRASRRELVKIPGIGPGIAAGIALSSALTKAEEELRYLEQYSVSAIFYTDEQYPARLRQNADCPALLYFKGSSADLLGAQRMVAVVGTRQPTDYGRAICEEIVEGLRAYNVVVVSGLAFGIDVAAHRKATALDIPNIAVLGHGLSKVYPAEHRSVALKITENGGLLSEYTHETGPDREHFPMRNRIIAGLCDALLVVETANAGGSMITAELAGQYQRDIFAVPGRLRDAKSAGCNRLIRDNRARLTESAADIAAALGWEVDGKSRGKQQQLFLNLTPAETSLIEVIRNRPQIPIDELTLAAQCSPGDLARLILGLEFKGVVRTLPGKRYEMVG